MQRQQRMSEESGFVPWLAFLMRHLPIVLFLVLAISGMLTTYWCFTPCGGSATAVAAASSNSLLAAPFYKPVPERPFIQRHAQSPGPIRIAIISGHRGSDSGAVCDDGLTEVEINDNISEQVAAALKVRGIHTEIFEEFDSRLDGYVGTALISLHADSCLYYNDQATGFKIAGSSFTDSGALSICVEDAYRTATQLPYQANTITEHMTDYHAFRKISPGVPAIILETGFMFLDREILTTRSNIPAEGVIQGVLCFLGQE